MTIRFIHTSDWQLGLKLAYIPGPLRARAQEARFQAVERIADLAAEHDVHAVVVAGDVFDDNAVGRDVFQKALDAMDRLRHRPVLLLPGNHDPATPDAALTRLSDRPNVHVLDKAEPFECVDGVVFYPCPLTSRAPADDPTAWIPAAPASGTPRDVVRVAIAHGAAIDFAENSESPRLIDVSRLMGRGLDYLALGDWHGKRSLGQRIWYSGTPEATRFKEEQPGYVLLVEIDGPGEKPRVKPIQVARTRWIREDRSLDSSADLDALVTWFGELTDRSWTLVELSLDGGLSYADHNRLDGLLERVAEELLWLRIRKHKVKVAPTPEDLARLNAVGFIGEAAQVLREMADAAGGDLESADTDGDVAVSPKGRAAQDALRLLFRFINTEEER